MASTEVRAFFKSTHFLQNYGAQETIFNEGVFKRSLPHMKQVGRLKDFLIAHKSTISLSVPAIPPREGRSCSVLGLSLLNQESKCHEIISKVLS